MSQSRRLSAEEIIVSTTIGLGISMILNVTAVPAILHTPVNFTANMTLLAVFTGASLIRGYAMRRWYNWRANRASD